MDGKLSAWSGRNWIAKLRSLSQAAAVVAVLTASSAQAVDIDVNNGNAGNTYNGATTAVAVGTTPVNVYFTTDVTLAAANAAFDPLNDDQVVLLQGSDGSHNPTPRVITGNGANNIFDFQLSLNQRVDVTISNLTLAGGVGGDGLRFLASNSFVTLSSDPSFVGNIFADSTFLIISSGDDLGNDSNMLTIGSSAGVLVVNSTTTVNQPISVSTQFYINVPNAADTATIANTISGTGVDVLVASLPPDSTTAGTVVLAGANNYTGTTTVSDGTLRINGSVVTGVVADNVGTLGGSGAIGGAIDLQANGAMLDPGGAANAIGTLTTAGAFNATSGVFRVDASGSSNDLLVANTATINSNATVFVHGLGGSLTPNRNYTFLQTTGALTGTFGSVSDDLPLVDVMLGYTANSAYFYFTGSGANFASVALTPNELAVGNYLDQTAGSASGDYQTVIDQLNLLNASQLRSAYNQMSGEAHATAGQTTINTTTLMLQQVANHLSSLSMSGSGGGFGGTNLMAQVGPSANPAASPNRNNIQLVSHSEASTAETKIAESCALCCDCCENDKLWNAWSVGYGLGGSAQSDGNASGASYGVGGLLAGVDRWADESTLVGVFGGYLGSGFSTGTPSANLHDNAGQGGLYALRRGDVFYVSGLLGGQSDQYTSRRNINFGTINRTATGNYDGWQGFGYSELGANLANNKLTLQPYGAMQYVHLRQNSISETGAGSLNLATAGFDTDSLRSFLGTRLRYDNQGENNLRRFIPELQASWLHEYIDARSAFNARFGAVGGNGFITQGLNVGRDWALLGAGLTYVVADNIRLTGNYYAQTNDRQTYHVGAGGLNILW